MPEYDQFFELQQSLDEDSQLIPRPVLYDFSREKIYAAIMDRLAQPLPSGEESPFSSTTPGSAHSILVGALTHLLEIFAHELNLTPDAVLLQFLRMRGVEMLSAQYPIVNLIFRRKEKATPVTIPLGTEVRSRFDTTLTVYTLYEVIIEGEELEAVVPARLNRLGVATNIRSGEFTITPALVSYIESVTNDGSVTSIGRNDETLTEAVKRGNEEYRTGQRCVTPRDYSYWVKRLMLELGIPQDQIKVNVIPKIAYKAKGTYRNLVTVATYPVTAVDSIKTAIVEEFSLVDDMLSIVPAEVVAITGRVKVRSFPGFSALQVEESCGSAIAALINPPFGTWGDTQIDLSIAKALKSASGVFSVESIQLYEESTQIPVADLDIRPWHLWEVQSSLEIEISR